MLSQISRAAAWVIAVAFAIAWLHGSAQAAEDIREVLRAKSQLQFERLPNGEVAANFDIEFENTTGKTLCIKDGFIPGGNNFDPRMIEFRGPKGRVPAVERSPGIHPYPSLAPSVGIFVVVFRGRTIRTGVRMLRGDYWFRDRGTYVASLRIDLFDCAKLGAIDDTSSRHPGWFLGQIRAEASSVLK
jgi:hypothetical protein